MIEATHLTKQYGNANALFDVKQETKDSTEREE